MNGSPKTSVNTAVNTVLTHAPGKTRVYLQKTGYTREIPGSASMPRAPYSQGHCANCSAHRLLKYAHRTMCARYKCQNAKGSIGARHGLQAAVRTTRSCHILLQDRGGARHALVRPRSTDRKEAAQQADCCRHTICYLTRCEFGEDEHDSGFTDTRWVAGARRAVRELRKSRLNSALKKHRKTEHEAADKAIVELEEGDDEA